MASPSLQPSSLSSALLRVPLVVYNGFTAPIRRGLQPSLELSPVEVQVTTTIDLVGEADPDGYASYLKSGSPKNCKSERALPLD
jgi:hypothetical protein